MAYKKKQDGKKQEMSPAQRARQGLDEMSESLRKALEGQGMTLAGDRFKHHGPRMWDNGAMIPMTADKIRGEVLNPPYHNPTLGSSISINPVAANQVISPAQRQEVTNKLILQGRMVMWQEGHLTPGDFGARNAQGMLRIAAKKGLKQIRNRGIAAGQRASKATSSPPLTEYEKTGGSLFDLRG